MNNNTNSLFLIPKSQEIIYHPTNKSQDVFKETSSINILKTPELPPMYIHHNNNKNKNKINSNQNYNQSYSNQNHNKYNIIQNSNKYSEKPYYYEYLNLLNKNHDIFNNIELQNIEKSPAYNSYKNITNINIQPNISNENQIHSIFDTPKQQTLPKPIPSELEPIHINQQLNNEPIVEQQQQMYQSKYRLNQSDEFKYVGKGSVGKVYINSLRPPHLIIKTFDTIESKENLLNLIKPLKIILHQIQLSNYAENVKQILLHRYHKFFVLPIDIDSIPEEYRTRYNSKYGDKYIIYQNGGTPFNKWIQGFHMTQGDILNTQFITMIISNFVSNYHLYFNEYLVNIIDRSNNLFKIFHLDIKDDNVLFDGNDLRLIDFDFLMPTKLFMQRADSLRLEYLFTQEQLENELILIDYIRMNIFYYVYNPYLVLYKYYKLYPQIKHIHNYQNWLYYWDHYKRLYFHYFLHNLNRELWVQSSEIYRIFVLAIHKHINLIQQKFYFEDTIQINNYIHHCEDSVNTILINLDDWGIVRYILNIISIYTVHTNMYDFDRILIRFLNNNILVLNSIVYIENGLIVKPKPLISIVDDLLLSTTQGRQEYLYIRLTNEMDTIILGGNLEQLNKRIKKIKNKDIL